jgi:hypothetical protein
MIAVRKTGLRAGLLVTAVASSMAVASPAFATGGNQTFNNADVTIRGGNSVAVATCVNWAQDWARKSDADKKRQDKKRAIQSNECDNTATAIGGDVSLTGVNVKIVQDGGHRTTRNHASVTIAGGDAVAVAACLNVLDGSTSAEQANSCTNDAFAAGGSVTVENTDITIVQH